MAELISRTSPPPDDSVPHPEGARRVTAQQRSDEREHGAHEERVRGGAIARRLVFVQRRRDLRDQLIELVGRLIDIGEAAHPDHVLVPH
jgi:hypothetical protein